MRSLSYLATNCICGFFLSGVASAGSILVVNASFEEPGTNVNGTGIVPGWIRSDLSDIDASGIWRPDTSAFSLIPDGHQVAYVRTGSGNISQSLSATLTVDTRYELSALVGRYQGALAPAYAVQLLAGGSLLAQSTSPTPATGDFIESMVEFTTTPGDPRIGQVLEIRLLSTEPMRYPENWAHFDDIHLNAELVGFDTPPVQPGDADMDLDFDQLDLVQVQVAAKYLTGAPATWSEGDWNGAPGGEAGKPPAGDGMFNQLDIIAALSAGKYLTGPYTALSDGGRTGDGQTSVIYDANKGELSVDVPADVELTSINIDSVAGVFSGEAAQNPGDSFDNDADRTIFKATFGGSLGSVSFGHMAQAGLSEEFVLGDLSVVGSLTGGGELGNVDLAYVPEPRSVLLLLIGCVFATRSMRRIN